MHTTPINRNSINCTHEKPIKPYKQLTIKNNKVDTLYIYTKK